MDELASMCPLVIGAARDARSLLADDKTPLDELARILHERWKGATVLLTNGEIGVFAYDGTQNYHIPAFTKVQIVDRVGAGDAFASGLLNALLDGKNLADAICYGHAVAALKMTISGDMALVSPTEARMPAFRSLSRYSTINNRDLLQTNDEEIQQATYNAHPTLYRDFSDSRGLFSIRSYTRIDKPNSPHKPI